MPGRPRLGGDLAPAQIPQAGRCPRRSLSGTAAGLVGQVLLRHARAQQRVIETQGYDVPVENLLITAGTNEATFLAITQTVSARSPLTPHSGCDHRISPSVFAPWRRVKPQIPVHRASPCLLHGVGRGRCVHRGFRFVEVAGSGLTGKVGSTLGLSPTRPLTVSASVTRGLDVIDRGTIRGAAADDPCLRTVRSSTFCAREARGSGNPRPRIARGRM